MQSPSHLILRHATRKKQLERHTLERFRAALPGFPDGDIIPGEEPDFLVATPQGMLGIELTTLHGAVQQGVTPPQASEAMRWRVVERAWALWVGAGHPPISCLVQMHSGHIERGDVERLATAIVAIAVGNLPAPDATFRKAFDWDNRDGVPDELLSVTVHRPVGITRSLFQCPGSSWMGPLTIADIDRVVAPKDKKTPAYRRRCDAVWLLISADTTAMTTWFQFDGPALTEAVSTQFERVFLLRHFGDRLHELAVLR